MVWIILVGALAVIGFLFVTLGKAKSFGAASNALFAEHTLRYVELVPENPFAKQLREAVIAVWRAGTPTRISDEEIVERFNRQDRVVQLNFIAQALEFLRHAPMIGKEQWTPVANPFVSTPSAAQLSSAAKYLEKRYDTVVSIPDRRLTILAWGVSDRDELRSAAAPRPVVGGPFIVGGKPIRAYLCGGHKAVLVNEPQALGPAEYLYALIVYAPDGKQHALSVTAEKSMASKLLQGLPAEMRESFGVGLGDSVFLGIFDSSGHTNLGPTADCTSLERFEARALREMKARLHLEAAKVEVIAEHGAA